MPYLDSFTHSNKTLNAPANFVPGPLLIQSQRYRFRSFEESKAARSLIARAITSPLFIGARERPSLVLSPPPPASNSLPFKTEKSEQKQRCASVGLCAGSRPIALMRAFLLGLLLGSNQARRPWRNARIS